MIFALLVLLAASSQNADAGIVYAHNDHFVVATDDAGFYESLCRAEADQHPFKNQSLEHHLGGMAAAEDSGSVVELPTLTLAEVCALSSPVCIGCLDRMADPELSNPHPLSLLKVPISRYP